MSKTVQIVAIVVVLALAVVLFVTRNRATEGVTSRTDFNTLLRCRACNETFKATLNVNAEPPFACTKCGKKEAWRLAKCRQCGEVFPPTLEGSPPRPPIIATCPKCGSQSTGAAPVSGSGT